jgi:hypothetical protein
MAIDYLKELKKVLPFSLVCGVIFLICMAVCSSVYGAPFNNSSAFASMYSCWVLVVVAVGSQILLNHRSGRAHGQLNPHLFISNWLENVGWILFTWTTGDPVYLITRFAGLWFDQFIFLQILLSSPSLSAIKRRDTILTYCLPSFLISLFILCGVPFLPATIIKAPLTKAAVSAFVSIIWIYVALAWIRQIVRNKVVGVISGRDFSILIPLLIEIFLIFTLINEYQSGTNRILPYLTMGISLIINTVITIQTSRYWYLWNKLSVEEQQREVARLREIEG